MKVSRELREAHDAVHAHGVHDERMMDLLERKVGRMLAEKDELERRIAALEGG